MSNQTHRRGGAVDEATYQEVRNFLHNEARLIDEKEYEAWLDCLTEDIEYTIPTRSNQEGGESDFGTLPSQHDNLHRLKKRVERLRTDYAWAEQPPTRTRHMVSNIIVTEGEGEDELDVESVLFLFVNRADTEETETTLLSARREDTLRRVDGELKLAERRVLLDHTTLPVGLSFIV